MRLLVAGAGAAGGYFGGRLLGAGRDVTFLVRPARAERLAAAGLATTSPAGNVTLRSPPTVLATELRTPCDAVILPCKAYDLDGAIESLAPAVGPDTAAVPLLNGTRHLDAPGARFGAGRVLGGSCFISANRDEGGRSKVVITATSCSRSRARCRSRTPSACTRTSGSSTRRSRPRAHGRPSP